MDDGCENSVLVSLGDNMGEILAQDRGRSRDKALNTQCRQAAAWQLAAGTSWRRRHVPTDVNVVDKTSRLVDNGLLQPGDVMVLSPAERRRAHRRAAEVAMVLDGLAAPRRCAPSVEATRRRPQPFAPEVFAGSGHLTGAVLERGFAAAGVEVNDGRCFNVTAPKVLAQLCRWIAAGQVWWLHIAPPCTAFSQARPTAASPAAARSGQATLAATIRLLGAAARAPAPVLVSVENPHRSRGLRRVKCRDVVVDMCSFGALFLMPTRLSMNFEFGSEGEYRCSGSGHQHARLQGAVLLRRPDGSEHWRWATSFASRYPPQLCRRLSEAAGLAALVNARHAQARRCQAEVTRVLEAVSGAAALRVVEPGCPKGFLVGWEDAIDTWGFELPGLPEGRTGRARRKRLAGHGRPATGCREALQGAPADCDGALRAAHTPGCSRGRRRRERRRRSARRRPVSLGECAARGDGDDAPGQGPRCRCETAALVAARERH